MIIRALIAAVLDIFRGAPAGKDSRVRDEARRVLDDLGH